MTEQQENALVRNVVRDTRKEIKYIIMAPRKLTFDEMMYQIRMFNFNPLNLKIKSGSEVTIMAEDVK